MNKVTKIVAALLVLLAVLLGIYAFVLATRPAVRPASQAQAPVAAQPANDPQFSVVVADKSLPGGVPIEAASLKVVKLPIHPEGSHTEVAALTGKIPRFDIGAGTPVTDSNLVKGLTLLLSEGQRAVAVPVDEIVGTGNRIVPGDFVDVFFTLKEGDNVAKTQARLLLSRLKVLTYGAESVDGNPPADAKAKQAGQGNSRIVAKTAVLAVPTGDVNRLLLATQSGKLQLVLRNPTDETAPDVALFPEPPPVLSGKATLTAQQRDALKEADNKAFAGTELKGLAGDVRAVAARPVVVRRQAAPVAPPVVEQNTVEVVRGTKRETVGF